MRKQKKLDKRTRMRLRELAKIENPYNLSGLQSWTKGFSTFGGMSKRPSNLLKAQAYENRLVSFVDSGRSQIKY